MRGRFAVECGYSQEKIDRIEFLDVLRMADYWALEPPVSYLLKVHWGFGRQEEDDTDGLVDRVMPRNFTPFHILPQPIKGLTIARYLRLNPGKTEGDFFKQLETKRMERYADRLKEAREKKNG
jgi:hypothetical protein